MLVIPRLVAYSTAVPKASWDAMLVSQVSNLRASL